LLYGQSEATKVKVQGFMQKLNKIFF